MPRIALYARVSTSEQSCESQLFALRAYTQARGLEIAAEYTDHGVSGAKARRPALDRLLADAKRRKFDVLAVTKLDRLARSVRHLTTLAAELEALGIGLVVLDQAIDTTTPSGRLLFHVLGGIAGFERGLIRECTRAGCDAARRRGTRFGRPTALSEEAVARLKRLAAAGAPHRYIASLLGVGKSTVSRELQRLGLRRAA